MKCRGLEGEARRSKSDLQRRIFQSVEGVITLTHRRACSGNVHSLRQTLLRLYSLLQNIEDLWKRARWATLPVFQTKSVSNNALTKVSVTFFQQYYLCRIRPPCVCGWRAKSSAVDTRRLHITPNRSDSLTSPKENRYLGATDGDVFLLDEHSDGDAPAA